MTAEQCTVYVRPDENTYDAFVKYRDNLGLLENTSLIRLLIERELKLRRFSSPTDEVASKGPKRKIPINLRATKSALEKHASDIDPPDLLLRLIRLELNERWLLRALEWVPAP